MEIWNKTKKFCLSVEYKKNMKWILINVRNLALINLVVCKYIARSTGGYWFIIFLYKHSLRVNMLLDLWSSQKVQSGVLGLVWFFVHWVVCLDCIGGTENGYAPLSRAPSGPTLIERLTRKNKTKTVPLLAGKENEYASLTRTPPRTLIYA